MNADARASLRDALIAAEPWLGDPDRGPRSVDAGPCDRCGELPRLLPTCGPIAAEALCRPCALDLGLEAWCDGHEDEGVQALRWAGALPVHWDVAVTLWWYATGELRSIDPRALRGVDRMPARVRAMLEAP